MMLLSLKLIVRNCNIPLKYSLDDFIQISLVSRRYLFIVIFVLFPLKKKEVAICNRISFFNVRNHLCNF